MVAGAFAGICRDFFDISDIELGCLKGTYGKNRFGPDPLEHS